MLKAGKRLLNLNVLSGNIKWMLTTVSSPLPPNEEVVDAYEEAPLADECENPSAATVCCSFGEAFEIMLTWKSGGGGACLFPDLEHSWACLLRSTKRNNKSCRSGAKHPPPSAPSALRTCKHLSRNCIKYSTLT